MSVHTDRSDASDSVTVPALDTLAADSRRALAEYEIARAAANAAGDAAVAAIRAGHPDAARLHQEAIELEGAANHAWADVLAAEVARHMPAMAPTVRLLWVHMLGARNDRLAVCCEAGQVIDP